MNDVRCGDKKKQNINASSVANFARLLKIMQQRREFHNNVNCVGREGEREGWNVESTGRRRDRLLKGNTFATFTSNSSLKPSSKDWLLSPESP